MEVPQVYNSPVDSDGNLPVDLGYFGVWILHVVCLWVTVMTVSIIDQSHITGNLFGDLILLFSCSLFAYLMAGMRGPATKWYYCIVFICNVLAHVSVISLSFEMGRANSDYNVVGFICIVLLLMQLTVYWKKLKDFKNTPMLDSSDYDKLEPET